MSQSNANGARSFKGAKQRWNGSISKPSAAVLVLLLFVLLALAPPIRRRLHDRLIGARGQALAAKLARIALLGRYRFNEVEPAMVWNGRQRPDQEHKTIDFLSKVVISTDSPFLLLFARIDQFESIHAPQFDISIDGQASETVIWHSVLMPLHLALGEPGEHTIVIRANPLLFKEIGEPYPLKQNVITEFAVPARYHVTVKSEPVRRNILVTVVDSIGQGFGTKDPSREAWTARLADSGLWPGTVMNRGYGGARLTDFCFSATSCAAFAVSLDQDYPNAAAFYLALGTNDFGHRRECVSPRLFADNLMHLLSGLHERNPKATLYLQTPLHRADGSEPNSCGDTLDQFRDAELRVAQTLSWIRPIDGYSPSFPQASSGSDFLPDGVHPSAQGQERYFGAVLKNLDLGADKDPLSHGDVAHI